MADPRFFARAGPLTLEQLATIAGAEIGGTADPDALFADVAPLDAAGPDEVTFVDNKLYVDRLPSSRAGACLLRPSVAAKAPPAMALLLTAEPYHGYARIAGAFHPAPPVTPGIAPSATVDGTASLGPDCAVDAGAVIGRGVELGRRCHVGANSVLGDGVVLGDDCVVGPGATVAHCIAGARVIIHAGVRIGQDGFGFALGAEGHLKVPQLGRVLIGDDVEIGANTTIDRGTGPDTVIGTGSKIDNLVQIGHNVRLGRGCVVVAQVGISGSTEVGDLVMMGGQAGLTGHLKIGAGARIGAQSGVIRDVAPGMAVTGTPAVAAREHWQRVTTLARLASKKAKD